MASLCFRPARKEDVEAIACLVNRAYRPIASDQGWTHEAHLVAGARISADQVMASIQPAQASLPLAMLDDEIVACILIEKHGTDAHLGMFAVSPDKQGHGIGRQVLHHAEQFARHQLSCTRAIMDVINQRPDLLDYYQRRGYQPTGLTDDYPKHGAFGTPTGAGLTLTQLSKQLP